MTTRLIFRFKDGSIDDETTVYTQRTNLRLISDHHIQRGPSYPQPLDMTIDAVTGMVTMRSKDGDKQKTETTHMDLPPDLSNGLILTVVKNLHSGRDKTEVSMIAPGSKPRVVKLAISPEGEERCFHRRLGVQDKTLSGESRIGRSDQSHCGDHGQNTCRCTCMEYGG